MALSNENILYLWCRLSEQDDLYSKPTKVLESIIENISCSSNRALILTKDGIVHQWKDYSENNRVMNYLFEPTKIDDLPKIKLIACSSRSSVAVSENDEIFIWGKDFHCVNCYRKSIKHFKYLFW